MRAQLGLVAVICAASASVGCKKAGTNNPATGSGAGQPAGSGSGSSSAGSAMAGAGSAMAGTGSAASETPAMGSAASTAFPEADSAKAKAANTRGYKLYNEKKYQEAAVEYRNAIAADPSLLLAHYNLACVASLTKDKDTALKELAWLAARSSWDDAARAAAAKARTDGDLKWIRDADEQGFMLTGTDTADSGVVDLLDNERGGKASSDPKVVQALASAPGKHDAACASDTFVTQAFAGGLDRYVKGPAAANLRDGVALLDASGNVSARAPIGCAKPDDRLTALDQLPGIPAPLDVSDSTLVNSRLFVVQYSAGGKQNVTIFLLKDGKELARAFDVVVKSDAGTGALIQTPVLGDLVYAAPGDKKKSVYRFDASTWKYARIE